jgi:hypothetical protein
MAFGYRKAVTNNNRMIVGQDDAGRLKSAEGASHI